MNNFFTKLSEVMAEGMTVNLTVTKKKEKLVALFAPIPDGKKKEDITPFTISGTGEQVDEAYDTTMLLGTAALSGIETNADAFLKAAGVDIKKAPAPKEAPKEESKPMFDQKEQQGGVTNPAVQPVPKPEPEPAPEPDPVDQPNTNFDQQGGAVNVGTKVGQANAAQLNQAPAAATLPKQEETVPAGTAPVVPESAPVETPSEIKSDTPKPSDAW